MADTRVNDVRGDVFDLLTIEAVQHVSDDRSSVLAVTLDVYESVLPQHNSWRQLIDLWRVHDSIGKRAKKVCSVLAALSHVDEGHIPPVRQRHKAGIADSEMSVRGRDHLVLRLHRECLLLAEPGNGRVSAFHPNQRQRPTRTGDSALPERAIPRETRPGSTSILRSRRPCPFARAPALRTRAAFSWCWTSSLPCPSPRPSRRLPRARRAPRPCTPRGAARLARDRRTP